MRIILLLADTQGWLNEMGSQVIHSIQTAAKKLFSNKTYRLSVTAFAHIIERHYYKTLRHPGTGKFDVSLSEILQLIKDAATIDPQPMKGSVYFKRSLALSTAIGINKNGESSHTLTVISDEAGNIITAYPE
ncbi:MAG: hypothetical protein EOP53_06400 [Sphingobacteriales bacterium]|nr:MAG: hypothetical protein EOP53_06400 [Sphingobacteriales bacterium]